MDIHPLVIHYPLAFLTTYAVFELLRFKRILGLPHWFYIKAAFVVVGELGAIATLVAAYFSPDLALESALSKMYINFMLITAAIFGVVVLSYLYEWFRPNKWSLFFLQPKIIVPLAFAGLFFVIVAGGLFGATIYGTHFDPFLAPVFRLLGVY